MPLVDTDQDPREIRSFVFLLEETYDRQVMLGFSPSRAVKVYESPVQGTSLKDVMSADAWRLSGWTSATAFYGRGGNDFLYPTKLTSFNSLYGEGGNDFFFWPHTERSPQAGGSYNSHLNSWAGTQSLDGGAGYDF